MPLPLLEYQHEGAAYLAARERAGLHDEMGVGKTATTIGALDRIDAKRVIVVAPAAVRDVWIGEIKKFSRSKRRVIKGRSIHDLGYWLKGKADILVVSYELAARWAERIEEHCEILDAIIFDEAHYLKNPEAARTRAMLGTLCDGASGLARFGAHVWFLTGTPMPNDPVDIWSFLRFCGGTKMRLSPFTSRYFKSFQTTFSTRQRPRDEMLPELRQCIRAVSLRRTRDDVGLKLPPVFLTTVSVDGDTAEVRDLLLSYPGLTDTIIDAIERGGLSFLDAQHIATLRRLIGEAKAPHYAKLIGEELQNGLDKLVVFGLHTRALEIVADYLKSLGVRVGMFTGSTSDAARVRLVKEFQEDKSLRVFIGNIRAAGTGLTLTESCHIDMLESSWSPADNAQALFRVSRIGQTRNVRARFISLADSVDELVEERVADKTAAILRVQGG